MADKQQDYLPTLGTAEGPVPDLDIVVYTWVSYEASKMDDSTGEQAVQPSQVCLSTTITMIHQVHVLAHETDCSRRIHHQYPPSRWHKSSVSCVTHGSSSIGTTSGTLYLH